jgi:hypothetical protein
MGIDARKYAGSRFLKLEDVRDKTLVEQIAAVNMGKWDRLNLVFESGSQIGLNTASVRALMDVFGYECDDWKGRWVEIYAGQSKDQNGNLIDAAMVRPHLNDNHTEPEQVEAPTLATPIKPNKIARRASAEMGRQFKTADDGPFNETGNPFNDDIPY